MLKISSSILFFFASLSLLCQESLTKVEAFGRNQGNLKMYTYVPTNLDQSREIPLVVVIHGCTQSAEMISSETGWNKLADSLNLILIYPEQKQINNAAKCYNFYLGFKAKKGKGETASIKQMIDYCFKNYSIDSSRVFITGMSAGGAMSNALLNAYPKLFNAGALFAAPSTLVGKLNKDKINIPKIAILQGDKDKVVPEANADKILAQWLEKNNIQDSNAVLVSEFLSNPRLSAKHFYNENKELKIVTILAQNIKHKLLIKPGKSIERGGKMDVHTADINFHSTYWIATFFGLFEN